MDKSRKILGALRNSMDFDAFVGQVQNRLELGNKADSIKAVRAVLTALSERLHEGEATDLASSLPTEIDFYVLNAEHGQKHDFNEFIDRIKEMEDTEESEAAWHAKAVMKVLDEAIPEGEMEDIRNGLPKEFDELFELVEAKEKP